MLIRLLSPVKNGEKTTYAVMFRWVNVTLSFTVSVTLSFPNYPMTFCEMATLFTL